MLSFVRLCSWCHGPSRWGVCACGSLKSYVVWARYQP